VTFSRADLELLRQTASGGACVLVSTHIHPDPDAVGSALAAAEMLSQLGARPRVILEDEVPSRCKNLPGAERIDVYAAAKTESPFAAAVIVDAGSLSRIGDVRNLLTPDAILFNIDHHVSNDRFGAVNFVDVECAATAEMLFLLLRELNLILTPGLADNLLAGLLTDTGRFRYSNTTPRVLRLAGDLIEAGAHVTDITNGMYYDIPSADILSMGAVYSTLELHQNGRISLLFARLDHLVEDPDTVVDIALSIRGVCVAALLSETREGKIRVSLRSKHSINVARIAESLGGGGHERAAGFRMKGTLETVRDRVLPILREEVRTKIDKPAFEEA